MKTSLEYFVLQRLQRLAGSVGPEFQVLSRGHTTNRDAKISLLDLEQQGKTGLVIRKMEMTLYERDDLELWL